MSRPGLSQRVVRDGAIDAAAWDRAVQFHELIGTCPACGGNLKAIADQAHPDVRIRRDYVARCTGCGHEVVAPAGKVLTGSAKLSRRKK